MRLKIVANYKFLKPVIQWRLACDIELIRMELEETEIGKFLTGFICYVKLKTLNRKKLCKIINLKQK